MKRILVLVSALGLMVSLGSCSLIMGLISLANDPATAASVVTQAGYTGLSGTPRALGSRSSLTAIPSFLGSYYYSATLSNTMQSAFYLNNQPITQDGKTYYVTGQVNFAYSTATPTLIYVYAPSVYIDGPDYQGSTSVDLNETYTPSSSYYSTTLACTVYGYVGGSYLSQQLSFSF